MEAKTASSKVGHGKRHGRARQGGNSGYLEFVRAQEEGQANIRLRCRFTVMSNSGGPLFMDVMKFTVHGSVGGTQSDTRKDQGIRRPSRGLRFLACPATGTQTLISRHAVVPCSVRPVRFQSQRSHLPVKGPPRSAFKERQSHHRRARRGAHRLRVVCQS